MSKKLAKKYAAAAANLEAARARYSAAVTEVAQFESETSTLDAELQETTNPNKPVTAFALDDGRICVVSLAGIVFVKPEE